MMYGWSPHSTGIVVHLNRRWDVQTIWKCMQNRSKWHVPWMRMFCHCFPFIVFTVPKDQRGEVGTSFQIVPSASEPVIFFTNRNTKIWTAWLIPLVILVGVSSNKSKQGVHPKSIGTVCFIPGQTHLATHVPSFTSRSSEILLWCLFNIATWEKKKSGCSGRTNRTQWCETASWKFQATVAGLHMASHVPCDLKIWLQMHGIPVQACPWNFESWSWLGGLGRWEQKNVLIWFDSIPSIFTGSRACSLKGWKSLKMGRNRTQILTGADVWIWCDDMFDLRYASDALHNLSRYLMQYLQLQSKKNLIWM